MKTIGLLGGMSWQSTTLYYQLLNEAIQKKCGGLHSAKIAMFSVDFHEIEQLMAAGDWDQAGTLLAQYGKKVEAAGADFLLICTNTLHKVSPVVEEAISIPLLHLADATAEAVLHDKRKTIGLLGTRFTMEQEFYRGRLQDTHGLNVIIPSSKDMDIIHTIIFDELCKGIVNDHSREEYLRIIRTMVKEGAEGIILGCTEICMLIDETVINTPLYDTTKIHAEAAVRLALA